MATAQIDYIRIDHDIYKDNTKGMLVHVGFDVQDLAGKVGELVSYFNYWQGAPLRDFDKAYCTEDGHVAVGQDFTPGYELTNYPDFQLFMPYEQLHMASGTSHLMCRISIWDKSQVVAALLAQSSWIHFYYSA